MLEQVELDMSRVFFLGRVPYGTFLKVIQISGVHVYLTYPFVLSWSMLEAMSAECLVVASATQPVSEVIEYAVNGLLFAFFDHPPFSTLVDYVLAHTAPLPPIRHNSPLTILHIGLSP